jgi:hypothetical protein
MGKHRHTWPEAKKLCRLNQDDIAMAKNLGFGPDTLVRVRPNPKQKWKLPVKYWIRELHQERFGHVLGEKPLPSPLPPAPPTTPEEDEEAIRLYGEQLYWEDYWDRNQDDRENRQTGKSQPERPRQVTTTNPSNPTNPTFDLDWAGVRDDDVPF